MSCPTGSTSGSGSEGIDPRGVTMTSYDSDDDSSVDLTIEGWEPRRSRASALRSPDGGSAPRENEWQARELVLPLQEGDQAIVDVWRDLRAEYGRRVTGRAHRLEGLSVGQPRRDRHRRDRR